MKTTPYKTSACRYCRHYEPEGHRGGMCQQLGVLVQGSWKACSLKVPAFVNYQEILGQEIVHLEHSLDLEYAVNRSALEVAQVVKK